MRFDQRGALLMPRRHRHSGLQRGADHSRHRRALAAPMPAGDRRRRWLDRRHRRGAGRSSASMCCGTTQRGKAASLGTASRCAREGADAVVTLDGDGQHQPEDVRRMLLAANEHPHRADRRRASRRAARPIREARRRANRFADFWISWAAGHPIADSQSGQRLYPAALLRQLHIRHDCRWPHSRSRAKR